MTGGWRAGKSVRAAARTFRAALNPNTRLIWLLGPDYVQCREEFRYILEWATALDLIDPKVRVSMPMDGQRSMTLKTGCRIETKSAKYPERIASVALDGITLCEPGQMSSEVYTMALGRVAQKRGWLFAAGTIEDDSAHPKWMWYEDLAVEWLKNGPGDRQRAFTLPSWSNRVVYPGGYDDPEIQFQKEHLTDYEFRRRYAGEPVGVEHPCFPALWEEGKYTLFRPLSEAIQEDAVHQIDGAIGVDFGTSRDHPSAVVAITQDSWGRFWIRELWQEVGGNPNEIATICKQFQEKYRIFKGRVDPREAVLGALLNYNVAIGGSGQGVPVEMRIAIGEGLFTDGYLYFDAEGNRMADVYESMKRMRRKRDAQNRLVYAREIGDDAGQAVLYALEELRGNPVWLPSGDSLGGMRETYQLGPGESTSFLGRV